MRLLLLLSLLCGGVCSARENTENLFAGEYAYWAEEGDMASVLLEKTSANRWKILIRGRDRTISLNGILRQGVLRTEEVDGTGYEFRLNGERELRMRKTHRNGWSPEDMEWVFFRKQ